MPAQIRLIASLLAFLALGSLGLARPWSHARAQEQTTVAVGDTWFCDESFQGGVCETAISVGETVVWDYGAANLPHTTTECGVSCDNPTGSPLWDSGRIDDGGTFEFTFDQAGTFLYRCNVHPGQMRGRIVVEAAAEEPTATERPATPVTPADGSAPGETPAPTATQAPILPDTGQGPQAGSTGWWLLAALAGAGAAFVGLGALTYRRARPRSEGA